MVVLIKKTKGGSYLGVLQNNTGEPVAAIAGSVRKVENAAAFSFLRDDPEIHLQFEHSDEVWEDTSWLLPSDEEALKMGNKR